MEEERPKQESNIQKSIEDLFGTTVISEKTKNVEEAMLIQVNTDEPSEFSFNGNATTETPIVTAPNVEENETKQVSKPKPVEKVEDLPLQEEPIILYKEDSEDFKYKNCYLT